MPSAPGARARALGHSWRHEPSGDPAVNTSTIRFTAASTALVGTAVSAFAQAGAADIMSQSRDVRRLAVGVRAAALVLDPGDACAGLAPQWAIADAA
jgi:hypothetical protein